MPSSKEPIQSRVASGALVTTESASGSGGLANTDEKSDLVFQYNSNPSSRAAAAYENDLTREVWRQLGLTARVPISTFETVCALYDLTVGQMLNAGIRGLNNNTHLQLPEIPNAVDVVREWTPAVLPKPEGTLENMVQAGSLSLATGGLGLGVASLAKGSQIANAMLAAPRAEGLTAAAASGASAEGAKQAGFGPVVQFGVGMAGGALSTVRIKRVSPASPMEVEAEQLRKMGAKFHEVDGETNGSGYGAFIVPETTHGKLFVIDELPPAGTAVGPFTPALLHPEMPTYLAKLHAMGGRLAVDTSLSARGATAAAYFVPSTKIIAISSNSPWNHFLHEFAHAKYDKHVDDIFPQLQEAATSGRSIAQVLPPDAVQDIGLRQIDRLQELLRKQLPSLAVNETLAYDAQAAALGIRQFVPFLGGGFVGSGPHYGRQLYQIWELRRLRRLVELTPTQQSTLREAEAKLFALILRDTSILTSPYVAIKWDDLKNDFHDLFDTDQAPDQATQPSSRK